MKSMLVNFTTVFDSDTRRALIKASEKDLGKIKHFTRFYLTLPKYVKNVVEEALKEAKNIDGAILLILKFWRLEKEKKRILNATHKGRVARFTLANGLVCFIKLKLVLNPQISVFPPVIDDEFYELTFLLGNEKIRLLYRPKHISVAIHNLLCASTFSPFGVIKWRYKRRAYTKNSPFGRAFTAAIGENISLPIAATIT